MNVNSLLACAAICEDFRPNVPLDADRWRREFDKLSAERNAVERRLIRDDRARLAMMAADSVILAANAPDDHTRRQLLAMASCMRTLAAGEVFDECGMFHKVGAA